MCVCVCGDKQKNTHAAVGCARVQSLQAAGREQQCQSSKQPKGKQVVLFSAPPFLLRTSPTSEQPSLHPQTR